ncbi:nuclear transport factor 2 family protein [Neptunicella marina]|uniref:Nuclear transport factor 2 family protein n=1 Tax=Neptunicella marina TaxID=2125989 RepID=A0A8J6M0I4_9ALTE|nr:nuclear transport factor 2 family protein [Neptunicella marina]MBC3767184.1 nuclear transport factor 2 family protein [Neptunicella marina]
MSIKQKQVITTLATGIFTLLSFSVTAQGEQLSDQQNANLKKAIYCMEIMENRPDLSADKKIDILRNECFAEDYIQHSPHVADGRDAVLALFAKRFKRNSQITTSIKRSASQGDLVWLHQHVQRSPEDKGNAVVNIFRMQNGKFAEHWNVVQAVPDTAKNNNTMF